jgi:hypothetical protein
MRSNVGLYGFCATLGLISGLLQVSDARGADNSCFCVRFVDGSVIRGCDRETKGPQDDHPIAACRSADGKVTMKREADGWTRVEGGSPGCDPCAAQAARSTLPERPRGSDETESAPAPK